MRHALEVRKTRKYVGTYKHMDEWEPIGVVEELARSVVSVDDEDPCETTVVRHFLSVRCDEVQPQDRIDRAIRDTFSSHGCAHEYDCCGCWSTHVSELKHLGDDRWEMTTSSSRNY